MKSEKTLLNKSGFWFISAICLCALVTIVGCTTTVVPVEIRATVASFDGTNQNSGILAQLSDHGVILFTNAVQRYSILAQKYGSRCLPPVTGKEAVPFTANTYVDVKGKTNALPSAPAGNYWYLDAEHTVKFGDMNHWNKEDLAK